MLFIQKSAGRGLSYLKTFDCKVRGAGFERYQTLNTQ